MTDESSEVSELDKAMEAIQSTEPDRWESQLEPQEQETQTEEATEETQEEEKLSKSEYYARLIEKDREIRELKEKQSGEDLQELAKTDPMAVLEKLGIGLDQILDSWAGSSDEEPDATETFPNEELESIKSELAEFKKQQEQSRYEAQLKVELGKIESVASSEPERWELISSLKDQGTHQLVLETATEMYKMNGSIPEYAEVCDAVEAHLEEQLTQQYEQMTRLNKIKTRLNIPEATEQETEQPKVETPARPKVQQTTLSSDMTSETQLPGTPTEEERVKRAIALLDQMGD